jgi:hypothetical protein
MTIKTFKDNKNYAIRYYNKVKTNPAIDTCILTLSAKYQGYVVMYDYKKN